MGESWLIFIMYTENKIHSSLSIFYRTNKIGIQLSVFSLTVSLLLSLFAKSVVDYELHFESINDN